MELFLLLNNRADRPSPTMILVMSCVERLHYAADQTELLTLLFLLRLELLLADLEGGVSTLIFFFQFLKKKNSEILPNIGMAP